MSCRLGNCLVLHSQAIQRVDMGDIELDSTESREHPNILPFKGTLLLLDEPSDKPPNGSNGHQIEVPTKVATQELKSLIGMGVNYQSDLAGHNPQKKIGVITQASIAGNKVLVEGLIWKKDFPDGARLLKANRGRLGMSMELADVFVKDQNAQVWKLEKFHFTGATILLKGNAAYAGTSLAAMKDRHLEALAAAASAWESREGGRETMSTKDGKRTDSGGSGDKLVKAIAAAVQSSLGNVSTKFAEAIEKSNAKVIEAVGKMQREVRLGQRQISASVASLALGEVDEEIVAAADPTADASAAADPTADASAAADPTANASAAADMTNPSAAADMTNPSAAADMTNPSAAADATDPTADASAAADPTADASASVDVTDPSLGDPHTTANPNPDVKKAAQLSKRGKVQATRQIAGSAEVGVMRAAGVKIRQLQATVDSQNKTIKKMEGQLKSLQAQASRFSDQIERRSLTPEMTNLLEKSGYDVRELMASKQKLSTADVDNILASAGVPLDVKTRITLKNQLLERGLMEDGAVRRN